VFVQRLFEAFVEIAMGARARTVQILERIFEQRLIDAEFGGGGVELFESRLLLGACEARFGQFDAETRARFLIAGRRQLRARTFGKINHRRRRGLRRQDQILRTRFTRQRRRAHRHQHDDRHETFAIDN
jgi:hypothetical protein